MAPDVVAGRYQVERAIGRGGMGTVWLCHDQVLGREVAVKQVGLLPGEDRLDVARALREARSSAVLNHRNVVAVYDAVDEGERIWLVMEYVPGHTLAELVAEQGPLPPVRVAWIGAQVADGLAVAHARGTVHRDVKPGNVLVTAEDLAKISDFGIARTHGESQITEAGIISGTPAYFSPEMARGDESGPAADVWALGATLFSAVEGRPLYEEQANPLALLAMIAEANPPAPAHAGILAEPLRRMLDPDPRSRWSMVDVAQVLHRLHKQHSDASTRTITAGYVPTEVPESVAEPEPEPEPVVEPEPEPEPEPVAEPEPAANPTTPAAEGVEEGAPTDPDRTRRRPALLVLVALVSVLVLAALAGYFFLGHDADTSAGSSPDSSGAPTSQPSASSTGGASTSPSESPSDTSPSETSSAPPASGSTAQFATSYYSMLPGDTSDAWRDLSPSFRASIGGRDSYDGFWSTISDVAVDRVQAVQTNVVDVSLTYTKDDGSSESEVRRLYLEPSRDGYVITHDEVVG